MGADDARAAGPIFHHDRLTEIGRGFLRDQTRQRVDRSTGR
jgi:hypothetical protein